MGIQEHEKLAKLLVRRDSYFLQPEEIKKRFREQFEKLQEHILFLKIQLELYQDELDIVAVEINYTIPVEVKEKYEILDKAQVDREIRWLNKRYDFESRTSRYIGLILKDANLIKNEWLREICVMHQFKREGLIQCPWQTKLTEE